MFRYVKLLKFMKVAREMILERELPDKVTVGIRRANIYRDSEVVPYVAHTVKVVEYDNDGVKIKEEYKYCSKISLSLGSIYDMCKKSNRQPEEFLAHILSMIETRIDYKLDPTWTGTTLHVVPKFKPVMLHSFSEAN